MDRSKIPKGLKARQMKNMESQNIGAGDQYG